MMTIPVYLSAAKLPQVVDQFSRENPNILIYHLNHSWFVRAGRRAKVDKPTGTLFMVLVAASPGYVELEELIDIFWGRRSDGGPDDPAKTIGVWLWRARKLGDILGIRLHTAIGRGFWAEARTFPLPEKRK